MDRTLKCKWAYDTFLKCYDKELEKSLLKKNLRQLTNALKEWNAENEKLKFMACTRNREIYTLHAAAAEQFYITLIAWLDPLMCGFIVTYRL